MKKFIRKKSTKQILFISLAALTYLLTNIGQVLAGGGDVTQTATEVTPITSSTPNTGSPTVSPTALLQTGTNNYANLNSSTSSLNYPACNGTCAFAIMRTSPVNTNNGSIGNQVEGVLGMIHTFSSPDQTNAETNHQMIDIQKQRSESEIASNYIKAIADACQSKDLIRAELNAKGLARIWNVNYTTLLRPSCG